MCTWVETRSRKKKVWFPGCPDGTESVRQLGKTRSPSGQVQSKKRRDNCGTGKVSSRGLREWVENKRRNRQKGKKCLTSKKGRMRMATLTQLSRSAEVMACAVPDVAGLAQSGLEVKTLPRCPPEQLTHQQRTQRERNKIKLFAGVAHGSSDNSPTHATSTTVIGPSDHCRSISVPSGQSRRCF